MCCNCERQWWFVLHKFNDTSTTTQGVTHHRFQILLFNVLLCCNLKVIILLSNLIQCWNDNLTLCFNFKLRFCEAKLKAHEKNVEKQNERIEAKLHSVNEKQLNTYLLKISYSGLTPHPKKMYTY